MIYKRFLVTSAAAFAIVVAGAAFAGSMDSAPTPKSVSDPVSDPVKQEATEEMLKAKEKALTGDLGNEVPSSVKTPASDPDAQLKTEKMLKEEAKALEGN